MDYTDLKELVEDSLNGSRNVFVQPRVARLVNRCVVFLPTHEELGRVYLPYIQNRVYGNFNYRFYA